MESYGANEARLKMRDILTAVERGEHIELKRYDTPSGVIVPQGWYHAVEALLAVMEQDETALDAFRAQARVLREGRRAVGLKRTDSRVVDHIDGNPWNNDPANLRIVDPKENDR